MRGGNQYLGKSANCVGLRVTHMFQEMQIDHKNHCLFSLYLFQELQQDKPQQQLLSPLPFPTTLPLLSASIASSKTVVADPIQHIQCMTQDLLHSIVEQKAPPGVSSNMNTVLVMENLCIALSSCLYQCLCDCDSFVVSLSEAQGGNMEEFSTYVFLLLMFLPYLIKYFSNVHVFLSLIFYPTSVVA